MFQLFLNHMISTMKLKFLTLFVVVVLVFVFVFVLVHDTEIIHEFLYPIIYLH